MFFVQTRKPRQMAFKGFLFPGISPTASPGTIDKIRALPSMYYTFLRSKNGLRGNDYFFKYSPGVMALTFDCAKSLVFRVRI